MLWDPCSSITIGSSYKLHICISFFHCYTVSDAALHDFKSIGVIFTYATRPDAYKVSSLIHLSTCRCMGLFVSPRPLCMGSYTLSHVYSPAVN